MKIPPIIIFLYSLKGRAARLQYILFFIFIVFGFVASKYADQLNCMSSPLITNPASTQAAKKTPSIVMELLREQAIESCKRISLINLDTERGGAFRLTFNLGFKYSNGHLSGTPFQSLFFLIFAWPAFVVTVKRFHDLALNAWPFILAPMAGLGIGIASILLGSMPLLITSSVVLAFVLLMILAVILFTPGKKEPNLYGPDPLEATA